MEFKLDDVIDDISKDISAKATDIYVFGGYLRDNLKDYINQIIKI